MKGKSENSFATLFDKAAQVLQTLTDSGKNPFPTPANRDEARQLIEEKAMAAFLRNQKSNNREPTRVTVDTRV